MKILLAILAAPFVGAFAFTCFVLGVRTYIILKEDKN
jgi:hypothetical protein